MKFEKYLESTFIYLLEQIHLQGFKIGLVGGTVRDFYLKAENKNDYDCELRLIDDAEDIHENFKLLNFDSIYEIEKLPYNIIRVIHPKFTCELSLPRKEKFIEEFSHSNFEAEFFNEVDYNVAFQRRDFTINAMMFEWDGTWKFIDPLNGKKDLQNKVLRRCSDSFFHDPVRFLRALRFKNL